MEINLADYGIELSKSQVLENSKKRVVVGMSGGVDSSVTAALCKMMGFETIGIFMRNWEEIDESGRCSGERDYQDVIQVCEKLEIPYYAINFSKDYHEEVFADFLAEYSQGHTPNPDILCNREIKFKAFFKYARSLGADFLATGHYCQIDNSTGRSVLSKGRDANKDQSYFLYAIDPNVLNHVLFPIGHLEKAQVRELATMLELATSEKKDSTGICFIGERNFKVFLSNYIASTRGPFVHIDSQKQVGRHDGHCFYTMGQRKGLGLGGPGGPWFVVDKDPATNTVFVAEGEDHPALYAQSLEAQELNWFDEVELPFRCQAKIRYRQQDQACLVELSDNGGVRVTFDSPQRAIAIRQSVVFYQKNRCLGGGIITQKLP